MKMGEGEGEGDGIGEGEGIGDGDGDGEGEGEGEGEGGKGGRKPGPKGQAISRRKKPVALYPLLVLPKSISCQYW